MLNQKNIPDITYTMLGHRQLIYVYSAKFSCILSIYHQEMAVLTTKGALVADTMYLSYHTPVTFKFL